MNIFKLAFELFIIYLVYKLIFDFIIPIYHTTRHVKNKMSEMQQRMQEQEEMQQRQHTSQTNPLKTTGAAQPVADDYIEFEEIK
ncbi:MAG: hypothetical protein JST81_08665 [Bacteroidetes bacterium]|jgi:sortase (surface protein transpeptidase)|nr:hypothetical protein [Bacteroidota bacterium]